MTARLPTQAKVARARPTRDEIELARLELSKIVGGTGNGLDLSNYEPEDIAELFRKDKKPFGPHAIRAGYIYVVGFAGFVKIGWTTNLKGRVSEIENGLPQALTLHHSRPGTIKQERALHRRFAAYRTRGEWFKNKGELASWIEAGCPK